MQLAQENNFPAFALHGWLEYVKRRILSKFSAEPSLSKRSAEREGNRRGDAVTQEHDQKAPPETEEETTADAQQATGKQQDIAKREK